MKGIKRVGLLALPAVAAAAALLCLAGGAYARGTADQALAVAVDGPGTVSGTGISCRDGTGDCVELYADGTSVTLTAASDSGATFAGWGGDCSAATGSTCTLTMSSARAVTATFTSGGGGNPTLTVTPTGNGKVTGTGIDCGNGATDCSESYATGTAVTLTETPNSGASFSGWGGACSGTNSTCTVTMNASQSVTAVFTGGTGTQTLTVSVSGNGKVTGAGIDCGNGATDCSEAYATGTTVALTEAPNSGATFTGWGGACSGTATTCVVSMSAPRNVTATFSGSSTQYGLSLTVTGSGRVTGPGISCGNGSTDCSELFAPNTTVSLTATPASGATFAGWGGDCSGTGTTCTLTMSTAKAVTASFTQGSTQKILTVSVGGSGRVTGTGINCGAGYHDCSNAYNNNGAVTLIATASAGATFLGWGGACTGTGRVCNLVMDSPKAVSASFSTRRSNNGGTRTFAVRSLGRPIVVRTSVGWAVTLRFHTSRAAAALLRLSRNGRSVSAFTFSPRAGNVLVGPFNVASRGRYLFRLTLSDGRGNTAALIWNLCISPCGGGSFTPAGVFVRSLGATVVRSGSGMVIKVRFQAGAAGAATVRAYRGGRVVSTGNFTFRRGQVTVDVPVRAAGVYSIVMNARNAVGRTFQLRWTVRI